MIEFRSLSLETLGRKLKILRSLKQISQVELAAISEISITTIREIEGAKTNPTILTLNYLSTALEIDFVDLFFID